MRNVNAMARNEEAATESEERAARNEAVFREANEKLEDKRRELDIGGPTPFLCECGNPDCTELIRLSAEQYQHVRSRANRFLIATGHYALNAVTIEEHAGYVIVEKHGIAGRIAEEEDRRK